MKDLLNMKTILNVKPQAKSWYVYIILLILVLPANGLMGQHISLNGAVVSVSANTFVNYDTLSVTAGTWQNNGTMQVQHIENAGVLQGDGNYNISGDFNNTGTFNPGNSQVHFNSNSSQQVPGINFNNLVFSGSSSFKNATGNINIGGSLVINSSSTLNLGIYTLGGTLAGISGTGTLQTQNTSTNPLPENKNWTMDVLYNSNSQQYITKGNYNNLNTSGGNRVFANDVTGIAGAFIPGDSAFTVTGSLIDFNGTSAQNIPAFTFNSLKLSGGSLKTAAGNFSIKDSLSLAAGTTLALSNYDITLKSTATEVARIGYTPVTAGITYGSGRFIAERYVPGRRKYRLFTSSVTSSDNAVLTTGEEALSIWGNWQNSGNNVTPNAGTIITGGSAADGFDQQTTTASMYTYDDVNKKYVGYSTANGKNTKYTALKAGVAYYLFVYGDRTNTITTSNPKNTTISSKGKVLTGDQLYTTASANPLSGVTDRYTMLGNPFASPVDWATISRSNISNTFWGWDPNLNSTGGYVTVSSTGTVTLIAPFSGTVGLNQYIQPGQGFFVKTTGASPTLTIKESDKVATFNNLAFRGENPVGQIVNNIPLLAINLQYPSGPNMLLADGSIAAFDNSFSNSAGTEDASKLTAATEVLAIQNGTDLLSIDARKMPVNNDTMFINMQRITKPQYRLQIFANQMNASPLNAYLIDDYLNTTTPLTLTDTNRITFNVVSGVPASSAANRFKIVFKDLTILPVTFRSVKAAQKNKDIQVEWSVSEESSTVKYQVEHSLTGVNFTVGGELTARGVAGDQNYQWLHVSPAAGNHFYRIKAINADGKFVLSSIVQVKIDETVVSEPGIHVFPNPVKNHEINLLLSNLPNGQIPVQIINTKGQLVHSENIMSTGSNTLQIITLGRKITTGVYYLIVLSNEKKYSFKVFIE